ncbi:transposase [Streptomyces sp. NPDC001351]|uniref:transposase n=1 Tax=Streptomyces sp. NPDC001351 TaxID=3364564 RepID=UPI0036C15E07
MVAAIGDPPRFPNGKAFRSYTGLVPKASETATPTARANPCPRPAPRCCAPP